MTTETQEVTYNDHSIRTTANAIEMILERLAKDIETSEHSWLKGYFEGKEQAYQQVLQWLKEAEER